MCITTEPATLSGTRLYAGLGRMGETAVHVIAYQNEAQSEGPNAMILPLPAAAELGPRNVVDTRGFSSFLDDIHQSTRLVCRSQSYGEPEAAQVFDVGSYTVVLARNAGAISDGLKRVPEHKRPPDKVRIFEAFEEHYPGWPLAICCWNGQIRPEPLLWFFEPKYPDWLFAPALDAHDGRPPQLDQRVEVDHLLAFGSFSRGPSLIQYQQEKRIPNEFRQLLPGMAHGTRLSRRMANGDFWLPVASLEGPAQRRAPGREQASQEVPLDGWS